jgi:acyl transferase domain-containing protein
MAAGREVLQGGGVQVPLTVENLAVQAALELEKPCNVQTVVTSAHSEEGIKYEISIHRQVAADQADKWKRHSHATFNPSTKIPESVDINVEEIKRHLNLNDNVGKAYSAIAEMGIQFGPKFQSIVSAWSGKSELLTEILLPEGSEEYICHPIVLDAMIQTYAFRYALSSSSTETSLQLPIGIKKFVWLSKAPTKRMFAYTSWEDGDGNVSLYSETGEQLAIMEGLELLKTNVNSFLRALSAEGLDVPSLYEEVWRPTMSVMRSRVDANKIQGPTRESPHVTTCLAEIQGFENEDWDDSEKIDFTFLHFLLRGIRESDWYWPEIGGTLMIENWKTAAPQHLRNNRLIDSFFHVLKDEGFLVEGGNGEFTVIKNIPSATECDVLIKSLIKELEESRGEEEIFVRFAKRCGQLFSSVLQGKVSPLTYMFPEDSNEVGAIRFYSECKFMF